MQRFLTKNILALQVVFLGAALFSAIVNQLSADGIVLFLISISAAEFTFLLPSVSRGETLASARDRVIKSLRRDPFSYVALFAVLLCIVKALNSGLTMEYLVDVDIWAMSKPAAEGLPSAVSAAAARLELYATIATTIAVLIMRNAMGPAAKRLTVQLVGSVSGGFGWICFLSSFFSGKFDVPLHFGAGVAFLFAFWAVFSASAYADCHYRTGESSMWQSMLLLIGAGGNTLAALLYLQAGWMMTFAILLLVTIFWGFGVMVRFVSGRCLLRYITIVLSIAGIACYFLLIVQPQNPISEKFAYLFAGEYAKDWEHWLELRKICSEATAALWSKYSWWGTGTDGFAQYAGLVLNSEQLEMLSSSKDLALNDWRQMLCERGIMGSSLFVAGLIVLIVPIAARLRAIVAKGIIAKKSSEMDIPQIFVFALVSLILVAVQSIFASPLQIYAMVFSIAIVLSAIPGYLPKQN